MQNKEKNSDLLQGKPIVNFYSKFLPSLMLVLFLILFLVLLLLGACFISDGFEEMAIKINILLMNVTGVDDSVDMMIISGCIAWGAGTVFLIREHPVMLYRNGISAYNYIELDKCIMWNDVHSVDTSILYVNLRDSQGRIRVTIPHEWWLNNCDELKRLTAKYAGQDHPLTQYFLKEVPQKRL